MAMDLKLQTFMGKVYVAFIVFQKSENDEVSSNQLAKVSSDDKQFTLAVTLLNESPSDNGPVNDGKIPKELIF